MQILGLKNKSVDVLIISSYIKIQRVYISSGKT